MILSCESCNTSFQLDESLLKPSGSKVRCSKCRHVFVAYPPPQEVDLSSALAETGSPDAGVEEFSEPEAVEGESATGLLGDDKEAEAEAGVQAPSAEEEDIEIAFEEDLEEISVPDEDFDLVFEEESPEPEAVEETGQEKDEKAEDELEDLELSIEDLSDLGMAEESEESAEIQPDDSEEKSEELEMPRAADGLEDEELTLDFDLDSLAAEDKEEAVGEDAGPKEVETDAFEGISFDLDFEDDEDQKEEESKAAAGEEQEALFDFEMDADVDSAGEDAGPTEGGEALAPKDEADEFAGLELDFDLEGLDTAETTPAEEPSVETPEADEGFFDGLELDAEDSEITGEPIETEDSLVQEPGDTEALPETAGVEDFQAPLEKKAVEEADDAGMVAGAEVGAQQAVEAEQPAEAPSKPAKKKKVSLPLVLLLVLVLLGGGGYAAYTYLGGAGMDIKIPFISDFFQPKVEDKSGNLQIDFFDLDSRFIENETAGNLFVITGKVKNNYDAPRSFIRVTGKLYQTGKKVAKQETVYCGNMLPDLKLAQMAPAEIQKALDNRFGARRSNAKVAPGGVLPFMVVFSQLPEDLEEFSIEVAGSSPAGK